MKKTVFIFIALVGFATAVFPMGGLKSFYSYSLFYSPDKGPFLEMNITIPGNSMVFKGSARKVAASVNILITFSDANGMVAAGNNYNLITPSVNDTAQKPNIVDVQRYFLKPGKYTMDISMTDNNAGNADKISRSEVVEVKYVYKQINQSDIQLIESYTKTQKPNVLSKSGYDMVPYSLDYYPNEVSKLSFYDEAYGTDTVLGPEKKVAMVYFVESTETLEKMEGFFGVSKQKTQKVNILFSQIDISKLPTGRYNLVVEVRDETGMVMSQKKITFDRTNLEVKIDLADIAAIDPNQTFASKYTGVDTLKEYIRCLWPISTAVERDWQVTQVKNADQKVMQQYIYAFWKNRNDKDPEGEWIKYFNQVVYVNKVFRCGKQPGYYTDRGRVYLQYGPPDSQQQVNTEPDSYPYEVWQYYRLTDATTGLIQTNRKFVFWNKDLDGQCFRLLHSDARGETKDDRWQMRLKQRTQTNVNLDVNTPTQSTYGSGVDDLFNNPR